MTLTKPSKRPTLTLLAFIALGAFSGCGGGTGSNQGPSLSLAQFNSHLSALWANNGEDKVTQDELRASNGASVANSHWDGNRISLFGAQNEVVAFNLVLESKKTTVSQVSVSLSALTGPSGYAIQSAPASGDGVFDWTQRNIELFYIRYLPIKGLSLLSYGNYDERHIPARMRRPFTGAGNGSGLWTDRPDHDKYYPDIAVPLELVPTFTVAQGQNQSIWADIYIPKGAPAGTYSGMLTVSEAGSITWQVPVQLTVHAFSLPDVPSAKTMLYLGYSEVNQRYTGTAYPNPGTTLDTTTRLIRDHHFQLAHRHKLSMIDQDQGASAWSADAPRPEWQSRLDGSLFTAAHGYAGPGAGVSNGVYSIGTYGSWSWKSSVTQASMQTHADAWVNWFTQNAPGIDYFLYLIDESTNYAQTEQWANWVATDPGPGHALKTFATINLTDAQASVPDLNVATTWFNVGDTTPWQNAANQQKSNPSKRFYLYNGKRPSNGSFATEDDGVALRELAWAQYKKGIDRWYFWEATYYNDYQGGRGQTDVFHNANTFGGMTSTDPVLGETGWNHSNGDGVLMYPGTDTIYPASSYGVLGPFASLRLKHWRRGIQDVDYLTLAASINPSATQLIVNQMVPKAFWENGITDPSDPTYVRCDISWSIRPDDWEAARAQLTTIIENH